MPSIIYLCAGLHDEIGACREDESGRLEGFRGRLRPNKRHRDALRRVRIAASQVRVPPSAQQPGDLAAEPTPERQVANSIPAAALLAFNGGILDAFLYLAHGRVFAGAMTGNAILCGIALLSRNGHAILHHALPVVAFVCGVWISEVLQARLRHHAVTAALALEAVGLGIASLLPAAFPDPVFIFLIALLAAFQIATFRTAETYSYNSTFITGNLRTFTVGLYKTLRPATRAEGGRQARDLGFVVAAFLLGAMTGAILSPRYGNHTLWLPVLAVLVVFLLAIRCSVQQAAEAPAKAT